MKKAMGISQRMRDALEAEGLRLSASDDDDGLYYECLFYTGLDWEKSVTIDLRDCAIEDETDADTAAARELDDAYENYSVAENLRMYLDAKDHGLRGVPEPDRLLEDLKEEEAWLRRFSEVAWAVANGEPVRPGPEEAFDTLRAEDKFFVVKTAGTRDLYWKTQGEPPDGSLDTCWTRPDTADRYATEEEARAAIEKRRRERGFAEDNPPGNVVRGTTETITRLYAVQDERN